MVKFRKIPLRFDLEVEVSEERLFLYKKLREWVERVERIANAKKTSSERRVETFRLAGYLASVACGVIRDLDVEQLESDIEKLEEEKKKAPRREEKSGGDASSRLSSIQQGSPKV